MDTAKQRIVLKHEPIPSIKMPSMTMRFGVAKEVPLDSYQSGDRVQFQFKEAGGSLDVTALEKLNESTSPTFIAWDVGIDWSGKCCPMGF
ncbi:hypothetical protein PHIN5_07350 [Polynucleobacter sp. HIN5]|nr:hypothetical protein PHIN5_07350 [Polynucleobacter sp. HIN5]